MLVERGRERGPELKGRRGGKGGRERREGMGREGGGRGLILYIAVAILRSVYV